MHPNPSADTTGSETTASATDRSGSAAPEGRRSVERILPSIETLEGAGFVVHRPFPVAGIDQVDPFLLLDHLGPIVYEPGEAVGAPDHPHRGFETVSYILEGETEHEDSGGHRGVIGAGDVQWMTAGAGVIHSEMPSRRIQSEGGRVEGFQIWVNLPRAQKMTEPRYQEVPSARIPQVEQDDGRVLVRLVAGSAFGAQGAVETTTPIVFAHVTLQPGGHVELPVPQAMNALAYGISGAGTVGEPATPLSRFEAALLRHDGEGLVLAAASDADEPFDVLVLAGAPLREPIARYGPFVMNSRDEIVQAFEDYEAGRLGVIAR